MGQQLGVRNPRTGETDYWITAPESEQLEHLCARLRQAQARWHRAGVNHRLEALQQWKQVLLSRRDELTAALVIDTGRWAESVLEVDLVGATIDRWCRTAPELLQDCAEKPTALPFVQLRQGATPYSLVGVISPWNFPLLLSMIDTVPALVAGSSVMVKPSEIAPRFIKPLRETIANVPELDGVLAFVEGAGETGAELIDLVDLVCFTGSVTTGRMVAEAAARQFIPAFLELGGKDPAIVLASADLEQAASAILWGSVANAGQSCLSIERIYVAEPIHDAFVDKLVEKAQRLRLAHPRPESGEIGPIIADRQADVITAHLRDAVEKGAIIHCGGSVENLGGGLWCRPTVISQVNHSMKIMTEETFGPIMPVMSFETVEEALALANDSLYGLSGAVFAGSVEEAMSVAERLEVGAVSINGAALTAVVHEGEKNAFKFSGLGGSRMGPAALRRFMRRRAFLIKKTSENDPWWFQETTDHASRIT